MNSPTLVTRVLFQQRLGPRSRGFYGLPARVIFGNLIASIRICPRIKQVLPIENHAHDQFGRLDKCRADQACLFWPNSNPSVGAKCASIPRLFLSMLGHESPVYNHLSVGCSSIIFFTFFASTLNYCSKYDFLIIVQSSFSFRSTVTRLNHFSLP